MKHIEAVEHAIDLLHDNVNKWKWEDKAKISDEHREMRERFFADDNSALQSLRDLKAKLDEVGDTSDT